MKFLPRYQPRESGVGCLQHSDPACLCDVVVTTVTPIMKDIDHKYHDVALQELDDDTVSERNMYEFFQIVLGLQQLEDELNGAYDARPITEARWQIVSADERKLLRMHAMADSEADVAMLEVPWLTGRDRSQVRNAYTQMAGQYRARRRKRDGKPKARAVEKVTRPKPRYISPTAKAGRSWLEAKRSGGLPFHEGTITLEEWRAREALIQ